MYLNMDCHIFRVTGKVGGCYLNSSSSSYCSSIWVLSRAWMHLLITGSCNIRTCTCTLLPPTRGSWTCVMWCHVNINFADTAIVKMYGIFANVGAWNRRRLEAKYYILKARKARNPIAPLQRNDSQDATRKVQYYSLSRSLCVFLCVASIFGLCFSCLSSFKKITWL